MNKRYVSVRDEDVEQRSIGPWLTGTASSGKFIGIVQSTSTAAIELDPFGKATAKGGLVFRNRSTQV